MKLTINSKAMNRPVTFSRPGRGHIFVNLNGLSGSLGNQICEGGRLLGKTIACGDNEETFKRICRNWFRSYMRGQAH
jgi:hypothetical protein